MSVLDAAGREQTTDVDLLRFPPQMVIAIITTVISIVGGIWLSTAAMRSDIRDIKTRMELQAELDQARNENLRESVESMKRRQELQQYEIQSLKEAILKGR